MIPLLMRRKSHSRKRHAEMDIVIKAWNAQHPTLRMRIERQFGNLIIEDHPDHH